MQTIGDQVTQCCCAHLTNTRNKIVNRELMRYFDDRLDGRIYDAQSVILNKLEEVQTGVYDEYAEEIATLEAQYEQIANEFKERIGVLNRRIQNVWHGISESLTDNMPGINNFATPEPKSATEKPGALYDSQRDYLTQMACYKEFQGKGGAK